LNCAKKIKQVKRWRILNKMSLINYYDFENPCVNWDKVGPLLYEELRMRDILKV